MSHVVMIMMLRQNKSQANGRLQCCHTQIKHVKGSPTSRPCSSAAWTFRGVVHAEFVPPGQAVSQVFYLEVLKRLCNSVR